MTFVSYSVVDVGKGGAGILIVFGGCGNLGDCIFGDCIFNRLVFCSGNDLSSGSGNTVGIYLLYLALGSGAGLGFLTFGVLSFFLGMEGGRDVGSDCVWMWSVLTRLPLSSGVGDSVLFDFLLLHSLSNFLYVGPFSFIL